MSLLQQLIQILSETPGNLIYHLVILFAAQAILGMAWWIARREPDDRQAQQLAWAAGGLLLSRLALLSVYTAVGAMVTPSGGPDALATAILPPLEEAVNTITAIFVAWALAPRFARVPHLTDATLLLLLIVAGALYGVFGAGWFRLVQDGLAGAGDATYNASPQTIAWSGMQIGVLFLGLILALRPVAADRWLRVAILGTLGLSSVAHLWNYPEILPAATDIPYWIRLGQLVALPLLAVFTYRHILRRLLQAQLANRPRTDQMAEALRLTVPVVRSLDWHDAVAGSARLLADVADADFSAVAIHLPGSVEHLHLVSEQPVAGQDWLLRLDDWPAFRLAMEQGEAIELAADGMGARQLSDLTQELGLVGARRLLVEPLKADEETLGLLLLAQQRDVAWSESMRGLAAAVGHVVGLVLRHARERAQGAEILGAEAPDAGQAAALRRAREERDEALAELQLAQERLQVQAASLGSLEAASKGGGEAMAVGGEDARVAFLEGEIGRLQRALMTAQAALLPPEEGADPDAADAGRSWAQAAVEQTALALREAQDRIRELERRLAQALPPGQAASSSPAPIKALAATPAPNEGAPTDPRETIEAAVRALDPRVRERKLRLYLDVNDDFPQLSMERDSLLQILTHLLENACQASPPAGHVAVRAQTALANGSEPATSGVAGFMQLAIQDSGAGIPAEDRARVFEPDYRRDPSAPSGIGDTGIGLAEVHSLVQAHGGRIWVESEPGAGNTFKVLLPIAARQNGHGPD